MSRPAGPGVADGSGGGRTDRQRAGADESARAERRRRRVHLVTVGAGQHLGLRGPQRGPASSPTSASAARASWAARSASVRRPDRPSARTSSSQARSSCGSARVSERSSGTASPGRAPDTRAARWSSTRARRSCAQRASTARAGDVAGSSTAAPPHRPGARQQRRGPFVVTRRTGRRPPGAGGRPRISTSSAPGATRRAYASPVRSSVAVSAGSVARAARTATGGTASCASPSAAGRPTGGRSARRG